MLGQLGYCILSRLLPLNKFLPVQLFSQSLQDCRSKSLIVNSLLSVNINIKISKTLDDGFWLKSFIERSLLYTYIEPNTAIKKKIRVES